MNKEFEEILKKKTITLEEFSKHFTPEQNKIVENEVQNYYLLMALRKLRKQVGLTQAQLAQKAKIPRTTITKIESGTYNPTINTLMIIADALDKKLEIRFV